MTPTERLRRQCIRWLGVPALIGALLGALLLVLLFTLYPEILKWS